MSEKKRYVWVLPGLTDVWDSNSGGKTSLDFGKYHPIGWGSYATKDGDDGDGESASV